MARAYSSGVSRAVNVPSADPTIFPCSPNAKTTMSNLVL